jgi:hypothetical protein
MNPLCSTLSQGLNDEKEQLISFSSSVSDLFLPTSNPRTSKQAAFCSYRHRVSVHRLPPLHPEQLVLMGLVNRLQNGKKGETASSEREEREEQGE